MNNDADRHSTTWESGPSDPPCFADGPGTIVEIDIDAPPATVWPLISDINFGRDFSEEFVGARWVDGADGPAVGNEFVGSNTKENMGDWDISCFIDRYEPDRSFGWVTADPDAPGAQWRFEIEPIAGASRLSYHLRLGPGPSRLTEVIEQMPDLEARILIKRLKEHRQNMQRVVEGIKAAAETDRP